MTKLLEQAIDQLKKMPEKEQDDVATMILDELTWEHSLDQSKDKLATLAKKALKEHADGKTSDINEVLK